MVSSAKKSSRSISPSSPQSAIILLDFVLDGGGVTLHLLAAQRGVVQHLRATLGAGVEHHALAEDRRHERVGLGLVEILVGGPEEELVGLGAGQQDDVLVGQLEPADVAALLADAASSTRSGRCGTPRGGRVPLRRRKRAGLLWRVVMVTIPPDTSVVDVPWARRSTAPRAAASIERDEPAARGLGDERDGAREIGGAQEVVVAGLAPLGPVLERRADQLGGQAPAHRRSWSGPGARSTRARRCPRVPSAGWSPSRPAPALAAP